MHTILGAGGPVANVLTRELLAQGKNLKLISRRPVTGFAGAHWQKADLKNFPELSSAAKGASVIYLCAGLQYNSKVWTEEWPLIMQNAISLAKENRARLLFFDNVYMYGPVQGVMTEDTPYNPSSKKGEVRARMAQQLMQEIKGSNIRGSIARAADFYGAFSQNSVFDSMVVEKYAKKQKAMWLGNPEAKHSFTYVPDAGRAMALLGTREDSDGQIWHLPTAPALKGIELIELAARACSTKPAYIRVNKLMLQTLGLFNKTIAETVEMYYQYQYDYLFDSSKFEKAFNLPPTPYAEGVTAVAKKLLAAAQGS